MNTPPAVLRPLATGELLDRSLSVLRAQLKPLFQIALGFQLAAFCVGRAYEIAGFKLFPDLMHVSLRPSPTLDLNQVIWFTAALVLVSSAGFSLWQLSLASLAAPPGAEPLSVPVTPSAAWARLSPALPRLLLTIALEGAVLGLGSLLGLAPLAFGISLVFALHPEHDAGMAILGLGALASIVAAIGIFVALLLRLVLVPHVVAAEGLGGFKALSRSSELMRGRAGQRFAELPKIRGSLVMLVLALASNALVLVTAIPQLFLLSDGHGLSLWLTLIELVQAVAEAAIAPFGMVALALFYADLRLRREGQDLLGALGRLGPDA